MKIVVKDVQHLLLFNRSV